MTMGWMIKGSEVRVPALGPIQSHIQWVPMPLSPGVKPWGREADHSPPSNAKVKKLGPIYIHFPIHLHGIMLNWLSNGATLPYCYMAFT
jgi:hypothetical protein